MKGGQISTWGEPLAALSSELPAIKSMLIVLLGLSWSTAEPRSARRSRRDTGIPPSDLLGYPSRPPWAFSKMSTHSR